MKLIRTLFPYPLSARLLVLLALAIIFLPIMANAAQTGSFSSNIELIYGNDYCTQTTKAAYSSCISEGREEYWTRWGSCTNVSDTADRAMCFSENSAQSQEQREECWEQVGGRDEVCELLGESRYDPQ